MNRYHLDAVNSDQVRGWCLDPSPSIAVAVEGEPVGFATCKLPRPDVARALPHEPNAATSGFVFNFRPGDIARAGRRRAAVDIRFSGADWEETQTVTVPWLERSERPVPAGPFPAPILTLLAELDPSLAEPAWSDAQMLEAANAIAFLARHGSKTLSGLNRYLSWVLLFWTRTQYAELNFPNVNPGRSPAAKDASSIQSSGFEMLAIAHHMHVLDSHRVPGDMLEFGCFKGFSTSMLSAVQHDLGRRLHVFDSFAGLPPSEGEYYRSGDFAGGLDEVRRNVAEFGRLDVVTFHQGFSPSRCRPGRACRWRACGWTSISKARPVTRCSCSSVSIRAACSSRTSPPLSISLDAASRPSHRRWTWSCRSSTPSPRRNVRSKAGSWLATRGDSGAPLRRLPSSRQRPSRTCATSR